VVVVALPDRPQAEAVDASPLDRVPPVGLVLSGVVSVQFGAALATSLFDELGPAGTSVLRLTLAALILGVVVRPAIRGRSRADLRLVVAFGVALGVMNLSFYEALDRIPLGIAVTIEFAGPLAVGVLGSRRALDLVWVTLAAAGIVLLANPGAASSPDTTGVAFALVAAACWGLYIVLAARAGPRFKGTEGVALAMLVGALIPLGPGIAEAGTDLLRPQFLAIGAGIGLLSSAIPYSLETEALRRIPRHVFGVLMSMEPAVAALAGFLVLGQSLHARELVAIALVVAASAGASRNAAPPVDA
jgi:inner membrane transporter RhtA